MPIKTDELVSDLYLKLEEIFYSDARTLEDKILNIRKVLEGFYKTMIFLTFWKNSNENLYITSAPDRGAS